MKLMDKAKQAALAAAVKTGLGYLEKDPEVNIPKLMELVDKFVPDGWYESQRNAIRNAIQNKDSNWGFMSWIQEYVKHSLQTLLSMPA